MTYVGREQATSAEGCGWTFFTNHAHVLFSIARSPEIRLREVAEQVGITERATQRIVAELEAAGYLTHRRVGRRNHYRLALEAPLRHPIESHLRTGEVIDLLFRQEGEG